MVEDISPNHKPVRSCTVEYSVRSMFRLLAVMGDPDPRLIQQVKIIICLRFQYRAYSKSNSPPKRVKPIPIQVLHHISGIVVATNNPRIQVTCDMIIIDFFFFLRLGKYIRTKLQSTPLCFCNIGLRCVKRLINGVTTSKADLNSFTFATLTFTK